MLAYLLTLLLYLLAYLLTLLTYLRAYFTYLLAYLLTLLTYLLSYLLIYLLAYLLILLIYLLTYFTYLLAYLLTYLLYLLIHSHTHSLSLWSTVLLEKLIGSQLVKKFPAFYGTRRFITAFTNARHLSLSWARWIQSIPLPSPTNVLKIHLNIIVTFTPLSSKWSLSPQVFPPKPLYKPLLPPYVLHVPPTSFFSIWSPEQYTTIFNFCQSPHHMPELTVLPAG